MIGGATPNNKSRIAITPPIPSHIALPPVELLLVQASRYAIAREIA
jgi:hypothetical protein